MKYEIYEFDSLSKYVQSKIINKAKKLLKKKLPNINSKDEYYMERNKNVFNNFLYNEKGRFICSKKMYEEEMWA